MSGVKRKQESPQLPPESPKRSRMDTPASPVADTENIQRLDYKDSDNGVQPRAVKPVPFQKPTPLITFSYISSPSSTDPHARDRQFEFGNASMKRFVSPPPRAKLPYGYDRWIRRPEEKGRLDSLLRAFQRVQQTAGFDPNMISVCCWRGVMTKILTAPYTSINDRDGPWEMNVMRIGQTLYFEEHRDELTLRDKNSVDAKQRQNMYYGYSFESYCTSHPSTTTPAPGHPPGWGGDVDTNEQWCSVVKTKLGDSRIIIGGEVDCVSDKFTGQLEEMIELKTSMRIRHDQDRIRFERKLLKFYFQSFLLGIPRILVGFRTPSGELTATETFSTMELPRMVRGKPGGWDPSIGLSWGNRLLDWLKVQCQPLSGDDVVWRVKFTPGVGVELITLGAQGVKEVESDVDEVERVGFLPTWYLSEQKSVTTDQDVSRPSDAIVDDSGWKI